MNLTEKQKKQIRHFYYETLDELGLEMEEIVEDTLDYMIDEGFIDLSEDEDGNLYESYNNIVWEYIEEEFMS
jgi:hypothetical protein